MTAPHGYTNHGCRCADCTRVATEYVRAWRQRNHPPKGRSKPIEERPLGKRELEAALLAVQELTNEQIARRMYVSRGTVKTQLSQAWKKLGARSKVGLVRELYEQGYITPRGRRP